MPVAATSGRKLHSDDPLDALLRPPTDESPEQRAIRLAREEEARKRSLAIDASIKAEKHARRKRRVVTLLLLGQSESGKSTTLRQFQRLYTPTAFREERILWRAVIQLNVVRSIRTILDAISPSPSLRTTSPHVSPHSSPKGKGRYAPQIPHIAEYTNGRNGEPSYFRMDDNYRIDSGGESENDTDSEPSARHSNRSSTLLGLSAPVEALKSRLLPLRHIETLLIAKLVPPNEDEPTHLSGPSSTPYPPTAAAQVFPPLPPNLTQLTHHRHGSHASHNPRDQEVSVRSGNGWKSVLARATLNGSRLSSSGESNSGPERRSNSIGLAALDSPDEAQECLHACRYDMMQLWHDEDVREILRRKKIRLEEGSGFFLNDLERVTSLRYMPSDVTEGPLDDVLKARLKTVGVAEYTFKMEVPAGRDYGAEWRIVDVGGTRNQRPTWVPFFDDVDAIIFLAPISGFDQVLTEDRTVNRLEDSVLLWKDVCSNKLLANVELILFLNKCDILEAKLSSGVRLAKYVRSYGDRENDFDTASKYLRSKFSAIQREYSPNPRRFYAFCTSVTDTTTTSGIIASVRDMVIRRHLKQSRLL
ncbi:hypothetical protein AMATHDRAFT_77514 [Amanita thiersii Skay4041]|uniref:G-alpha-domain-containing protein n=1 Tax=Amanita thiersii Skay4041 TaxID=703135 RepID=A0A2A9N8P3_9AGAR|nr:hypothetical protein AMATHDRAFT_77514 [Amanita thiersii Skay4041]